MSFLLPVALFTRAWIEIRLNLEEITFKKSPSSRGRGLKLQCSAVDGYTRGVALFTRAWIEIMAIIDKSFPDERRPLHEGVD